MTRRHATGILAPITDPVPPPEAPWRSVLDRLTVAGVIADRTGAIVYANDAVEALLGWPAADLVGCPVTTLVPRHLLSAHRDAFDRWARGPDPELDGRYLRLTARTSVGDEMPVGMVLSPVAGPDGEDLVLGLMRPRDASHEAVNAVALELVSVLSDERSVDEAVSGLLRAIGDRLAWDATNLWIVDDDRRTLRAVAQWSRAPDRHQEFLHATATTGFASGEGLPGRVWASGAPVTIAVLGADADFPRLVAAQAAGLHTAFAFPVEHDGQVVGVIEMFRSRAEPIEAEHVAVLAGIGIHLGPYLNRVRARERERRAERRLRLINEGTQRLARWLDYPAPLDDLCELLVPEVADTCVIDLVRDSHLERVGRAFASAAYEADVELLGELIPLDTIQAGPVAVVESGETIVHDEVDAATLKAGLPVEVPDDLARRLAPVSTVIVPLTGRNTVVGTLSLSRQSGPFDDDERRFAEELGRHVGLAVANAALYERERAVAAALQQSLLPPHLPEVPGLEVASRYEPGGTRMVVGGDFYDLFEVEGTCWYALVGDVCGTGAEAAAITSQARYTARAVAGHVDGPGAMLDEVNDALLERGDTRFCTVLVARLTPEEDGFAVTVASGGHPPPVHVSHAGTRLVDCPGILLGIYADAAHAEVEVRLRPGEALALYTDGVTETRDTAGEMLGEERLVEVLDACVDEDAEKTAAQLVQAAVDHAAFTPADDIAVLVLRAG